MHDDLEDDLNIFNAKRELDDTAYTREIYEYIINELKDDVLQRNKMIAGLQGIIKKQQETMKLHGLEIEQL